MSRLSVPSFESAIGADGPFALKVVLGANVVLVAGTPTKRDQQVIDYCVATHNHLAKLAEPKPEVLTQIRDGQPTGDAKRDERLDFVRKLAQSSGTDSDNDFATIRTAGYSDAQLVAINLALATTASRTCSATSTTLRSTSPRSHEATAHDHTLE